MTPRTALLPLPSRAATALLAVATIVLAAACAQPAATGATGARGATQAVAAATHAATTTTDAGARDEDAYSIHDLDATWRDQHGAARTLASLRGRPQVLAMVYTHCATTCPVIVTEMKRLERAVPAGSVGFVLVTLDPERDSTARLAAFAAERGLEASRWTLLGGDPEAVRELAAAIGVRYRRLSAAELAHANVITVLDAEGTVVHQAAGLGDVDATLAALRALAR